MSKGDKVIGRYLGVTYSGTVKSVRLNERTGNTETEIDFDAPLSGFRGRDWDVRTGIIVTGCDEGEFLQVVKS